MHSTVVMIRLFDQEENTMSADDIFDLLPRGADYADELNCSQEEMQDLVKDLLGPAAPFENGYFVPDKDQIELRLKMWYDDFKNLVSGYTFEDYKKNGYETWRIIDAIDPAFGLKFVIWDYGMVNPYQFYTFLLGMIKENRECRFAVTQIFDYHF